MFGYTPSQYQYLIYNNIRFISLTCFSYLKNHHQGDIQAYIQKMMNSYSSHVVYSQQVNFLYLCPLNHLMNYILHGFFFLFSFFFLLALQPIVGLYFAAL